MQRILGWFVVAVTMARSWAWRETKCRASRHDRGLDHCRRCCDLGCCRRRRGKRARGPSTVRQGRTADSQAARRTGYDRTAIADTGTGSPLYTGAVARRASGRPLQAGRLWRPPTGWGVRLSMNPTMQTAATAATGRPRHVRRARRHQAMDWGACRCRSRCNGCGRGDRCQRVERRARRRSKHRLSL